MHRPIYLKSIELAEGKYCFRVEFTDDDGAVLESIYRVQTPGSMDLLSQGDSDDHLWWQTNWSMEQRRALIKAVTSFSFAVYGDFPERR